MTDDQNRARQPEPGIGTRLYMGLLRTLVDLQHLVPSLVMSAEERRQGGLRAAQVEALCH